MVDFITKLLLVARKDAILVVYNRLSKMMYFVTTTEETLVERLVRLFRNNMWKLHRLPESMVLDKICSRVDKGAEQNIGDVIDILSPTNRYANQINELEGETISPILCKSQTEELARMASDG